MQSWLILCSLFFLQAASAQNIVPVSSTGIGDIKLNMHIEQVEKIVGQSIKLKRASLDNYAMDTAIVQYKGVTVTIEWIAEKNNETEKLERKVFSLEASHPSLQTRSGITLGSDKFEVVRKLDGMYLTLQPDWRMDNKPDKSKYAVIILTDGDNGSILTMYFENNKLTGFCISNHEGC